MTQLALFDYKQLDAVTRMIVNERTVEIKSELKKIETSILQVGEALSDVRDRLKGQGGGGFEGWIEREFGWGKSTAYNFINVYELARGKPIGGLPFDQSALYLLAQKNTPDDVVEQMIAQAQEGVTVERQDVLQALSGYQAEKAAFEEDIVELPPDPNSFGPEPDVKVTHPNYGNFSGKAYCEVCMTEGYRWRAVVDDQFGNYWLCLTCNSATPDALMVFADLLSSAAKKPASVQILDGGNKLPMSNSSSGSNDTVYSRDMCQTPWYGLLPLTRHICSEWTVWESAAGEGLLVEQISALGVQNVIASDILTGQNYFEQTPDVYDVEITNVPFSRKYAWLKKAYERGKPFAFLMPVSVLGSSKAQALFAHYGMSMILINKRLNYKMPNKGFLGAGAQFASAWFTWQFNLPSEIVYYQFPDKIAAQIDADNARFAAEAKRLKLAEESA